MEGNHKNLTGLHNIRHNNFEINRQEMDLAAMGDMIENLRQDPFAQHHQYLSKWGTTLKNSDRSFEEIKFKTDILRPR